MKRKKQLLYSVTKQYSAQQDTQKEYLATLHSKIEWACEKAGVDANDYPHDYAVIQYGNKLEIQDRELAETMQQIKSIL